MVGGDRQASDSASNTASVQIPGTVPAPFPAYPFHTATLILTPEQLLLDGCAINVPSGPPRGPVEGVCASSRHQDGARSYQLHGAGRCVGEGGRDETGGGCVR